MQYINVCLCIPGPNRTYWTERRIWLPWSPGEYHVFVVCLSGKLTLHSTSLMEDVAGLLAWLFKQVQIVMFLVLFGQGRPGMPGRRGEKGDSISLQVRGTRQEKKAKSR